MDRIDIPKIARDSRGGGAGGHEVPCGSPGKGKPGGPSALGSGCGSALAAAAPSPAACPASRLWPPYKRTICALKEELQNRFAAEQPWNAHKSHACPA